MDQSALIKGKAFWAWEEYARTGALLRGSPGALPLRTMLADMAERVFQMTVIEDETLTDTNIEGEFNRDEGLILLRPGLPTDRAIFVLAHELGHAALVHPLHQILDTAAEIDPDITPDDLSVERQQRVTGIDLSDGTLTALRGYNQRDVYEMQANAFATELLVPCGTLRAAILNEPGVAVSTLAMRLEVPEHLVRTGLAQALFSSSRTPERPPDTPPPALDAKQKEAVECPTPALVIAGPGAGKTRVLATRYARLVQSGIPPRQIIALTFANKAANELRERLAGLLGEEHAASVEVATFHAFGLQLLQQYGAHIGLKLPLRLITPMDAQLLFRRRAARMALGAFDDVPRALENLGRLLKAVARSKEEGADPDQWDSMAVAWEEAHPGGELPIWVRDGTSFYREYQKTLRRHGLLDYGDLQMEALRLFRIPSIAAEIRERYQYVLVDEFQDINFVSGQLVRALDGGRGVVWAVGDPRQSIYGFRGASPVNLSRFRSPEYYPGAAIITLDRNYRSVPDIVSAGASVPVPPPSDPELSPPPLSAHRDHQHPDPAVTAIHLASGEDEMSWLAGEIRRQWQAGTSLSDISVLTRKNKHATQVAEALRAAGIPHTWAGPIQDRPVFCVLTSALLLAADDPSGIVGLATLTPLAKLPPDITLSEADLRALFAGGRGRWKARRLLAVAVDGQIDGLSEDGKEACRALCRIASSLSRSSRPHHNLCVYLFEHARWLRGLLPEEAQKDGDVRVVLATVGQLLDLAANFGTQREALARNAHEAEVGDEEEPDRLETGADTGSFLNYLRSALQSGDLGVPTELDVQGDAVSLITAHRSKGLEWPVVFVPFCMEGQFPSKEQDDDLPLPPGIIATDGDPAETHAREEACLFYVAVTRAQDRLLVSSADAYGPRTRNSVSELCHAMTKALADAGRLNTAASSPPTQASGGDTSVAGVPRGWLPYHLPERIHERDLRLYDDCPRKFLYEYVYGLPDTDANFLAFHRAVYGAARDAGGNPDVLREKFKLLWEESGPHEDYWQTPLLRRVAERLVTHIEDQLRSGVPRLFRQQKTVELGSLESGTTYGLLVTVDEEAETPDGKRIFRRHKQGTRLPKRTPDEDIATLYAILAEQERPDASVSFYYPHIGQDMLASIGEKKKANLRARTLQMITAIENGEMPARPGDDCKRCPHLLICGRDRFL